MAMDSYVNDYTLGRGELYFAQFKKGTRDPGGELYFGNTPEFNVTIESENLDHYSSDRGIREKDASIALQTNRTGSFITDNISMENIALFFFGSISIITDAGGEATDTIAAVQLGRSYQLGVTAQNPVGVVNIDTNGAAAPKVTSEDGQTTYVVDEDYKLDAAAGRVYLLKTGKITDGSAIKIVYTTIAGTRERAISGSTAVEGSLRYITYNPVGSQKNWFAPYAKISPNGEYALKGDEWQQIPFTIEILKKPGYEAIYVEGQPQAEDKPPVGAVKINGVPVTSSAGSAGQINHS